MKLFEVLPERLFQVFSGRNRQIYAEALLLLYEQYRINRFGIQYEVMRDLMQELIESQEEEGVIYEMEEDEERVPAGTLLEAGGEDLARLKAGALLRRLDRLQWIQVEVRDNFRRYIVLPRYASRLLAVFQELCENRAVEYQRFAFVTYQLLSGEEARLRPGFAILEAHRMTQEFLEELRALVNNMKYHMEQVVAKTSIQEVLDHHFEEYKAQIIDRSYHRLKTSDHVSRYRQRILTTVQEWLLDPEWMARAVEDALRSEFFNDREEAAAQLRRALMDIEEIYRGLDEMFYQIDLRHNQYLRASYERARYLSQHSSSIDRYLAHILEWTAAGIREGNLEVDSCLTGLFTLMRLNLINEQSLYTPRRRRTPHRPEPVVMVAVPEELKRQLREQSLERVRQAITREKVGAYVLGRMGTRREMGIAELAPQNMEEFLYLLYVYLYGYDGLAGYRLVADGENRVLDIGGYRFYDRRVIRVDKAGKRRGV
ncbi:hypothetical protein MHOCP_04160 [Moorella humiferrea]|uniref:Wadjet anti-phage system protein JetA family protein n=1 Tax=Neomoorella humiferrea TaxID=676965 RepID=UPI0030CF7FDB